MSDPVIDLLWNFPGLPAWQTDADGADTNGPQDDDLIKYTTPTALAGELRRIKSETRRHSLDPVWINYGQWNNAPSTVLPSYDGTVTPVGSGFTLVGNWTASNTNPSQRIALVGRRIRAHFGQPPNENPDPRVSTIIAATFGGGVTRVQVTPANLMPGLRWVEFSALGSALAVGQPALGGVDGLNAFPLDLTLTAGTNPTLVVPPGQGGTGRTGPQTFDANSDVQVRAGSLGDDVLNLDVVALQGNVVQDSTPTVSDLDQVLYWHQPGGWGPALLSQLVQVPVVAQSIQTFLNFTMTGTPSAGTLIVPLQPTPVHIKWIVGPTFTSPKNDPGQVQPVLFFDTTFPNTMFACMVSIGGNANGGVICTLGPSPFPPDQVTILTTNITANDIPNCILNVLAIGN